MDETVGRGAEAVTQTSSFLEQMAAGNEQLLSSVEVQRESIAEMDGLIRRAARNSLSLRSVISQFKLPSGSKSHELSEEIRLWVEQALGVRAVMVSMIESGEKADMAHWLSQKREQEEKLEQCVERLKNKVSRAGDRRYLEDLERAWAEFDAVKNRNAQWMQEGRYEKAAAALTSVGREKFKAAMDIAHRWMDG